MRACVLGYVQYKFGMIFALLMIRIVSDAYQPDFLKVGPFLELYRSSRETVRSESGQNLVSDNYAGAI